MREYFVGLMSGTSLDGIDGVLVSFDTAAALEVHAHAYQPFDATAAAEWAALNSPGNDELHRGALAANGLARMSAMVVEALLRDAGNLPRTSVRAIGSHGQTVRHRPGEFDATGYTVQLDNPALLAELTAIDVVADFRRRDVAAGGQGAPLVPAFHRAVFGRAGEALAVLNIGGMSNLTVLAADGATTGFDCGPGNALMDHWCHVHRGTPFDDAGAWAATGRVDRSLLDTLLAEPYFALRPPKSTGRDLFNPAWLKVPLERAAQALAPSDVQATLAELTARACASSVEQDAPDAQVLLVCGGGAHNAHLMSRLATALPGRTVQSSVTRGLPPTQVEACAFAWLARAFLRREPANVPAVTGAAGPRVLGALYPGRPAHK
jgi:anhydro-N-acetylmuramic acid kinase